MAQKRLIARGVLRAWGYVNRRTDDGALTRRARKARQRSLRLLRRRNIDPNLLFSPEEKTNAKPS